MPRHRRFLSLWITTGLVLGIGSAFLGVGGPGVANACSCVASTDGQAFEAADVAFVGDVVAASVDREQVVPDTTLSCGAPSC